MGEQHEHWWHRVGEDVQRWLKEHPHSELSTTAFDAVIGAGGLPAAGRGRRLDELPDARLLSDGDWDYIAQQPHPDHAP